MSFVDLIAYAHVVLVLDFTPRWDNGVRRVAGTLIVRRLINVEVLERHNEVAGFIYAVIGVVYAVLLGFAAVTVWEGYDRAQAAVEREADDLADLFRDAQTFPRDTRTEIENQIRNYVGLVVEKEWPAMANAGQAQRSGMRTSSFGKATINFNRKAISNALGTRIR